ncbi:MAG: SpoIIE family protein phosphatase [Fibrobacteria bacterium]|nr:SpoIIE family protein phosphatase [Fibrobacteria bacterium]
MFKFLQTMTFSLLVTLIVPVSLSFLLSYYAQDYFVRNFGFHNIMETAGGVIALILAVLYIQKTSLEEKSWRGWIACGLIWMGTLDIFHAGVVPGNTFVWFHSLATFMGGLFFTLVWFSHMPRFLKYQKIIIVLSIIGAPAVGVFSLLFENHLPAMTQTGVYSTASLLTSDAIWMNIGGGLFFGLSGFWFFWKYNRFKTIETMLFMNLCFLFSMAGILFFQSNIWDASWWLWHELRLIAYALVLLNAFYLYLHGMKENKGYQIELETANRNILNELEIAKKIQQSIYPDSSLHTPHLKVVSKIKHKGQVGGDYYDVIPLPGYETALLMVDVTGHDIAAAFVVAMAKISFTAHVNANSSIVDIYNKVNSDIMAAIRSGLFMTAFLMFVDIKKGILRYGDAGHGVQYLYKPKTKSLEGLTTEGMMLGVVEQSFFEEGTVEIEAGDKLILFTDGLYETRNKSGEMYGRDRLCDIIQKAGHLSVEKMHQSILDDYTKFCQGNLPKDDRCLLIAEVQT